MRITLGVVLGGIALATGVPSKAAAPAEGFYAANVYVSWISGTGCLDTPGANYLGIVHYLGIQNNLIAMRIPAVAGIVSTLHFSIKSGAGGTTPSGDFSWQVRGANTVDESGSFSAKITEIDQYSFAVAFQERYGTSCLEEQTVSLTRL
jgi:hypothetical protein